MSALGELDSAERKRALAWLDAHDIDVWCAECDHREEPTLLLGGFLLDGTRDNVRFTYPVLILRCNACGHLRWFDAVMVFGARTVELPPL